MLVAHPPSGLRYNFRFPIKNLLSHARARTCLQSTPASLGSALPMMEMRNLRPALRTCWGWGLADWHFISDVEKTGSHCVKGTNLLTTIPLIWSGCQFGSLLEGFYQGTIVTWSLLPIFVPRPVWSLILEARICGLHPSFARPGWLPESTTAEWLEDIGMFEFSI